MSKWKFLMPLAGLAATVTSGQANADIVTVPAESVAKSDHISVVPFAQSDKMIVRHDQDLFSFLLKRNDKNEILAMHQSHSSHASHSSHYSGS
ncbi:MAG: His-Xaa-Ser repeat protein HxsA2 [Halothiobacillus sp.]|jgi:hypothetical protein|nr:His-Xaa-Ser repeat protein HxsA2 [Halothiobacillus sp.]